MKKKIMEQVKKTAVVILTAALAASMFGCGKASGGAEQAPAQQAAAEESAPATGTAEKPINPEEVKNEEVVKEEPAEKAEESKETAEQAPAATTQPKEENTKEEKPEEKEVIEKPEASEENIEAEKKKQEQKKKEKAEKAAAVDLNDVLDGKFTFDGMELTLPIDVSGMKLGNWTLQYETEGDPSEKKLAPHEIVTAKMTSPDYTDDDIIVKAEFGNYSESEVPLTDLSMTGIYITKGKGKDGAEPKLPAVQMPCEFTWGKSADEIRTQLGEASFSGSFDYDFDYMYENGLYLLELGGMNDTGIEYMVYTLE